MRSFLRATKIPPHPELVEGRTPYLQSRQESPTGYDMVNSASNKSSPARVWKRRRSLIQLHQQQIERTTDETLGLAVDRQLLEGDLLVLPVADELQLDQALGAGAGDALDLGGDADDVFVVLVFLGTVGDPFDLAARPGELEREVVVGLVLADGAVLANRLDVLAVIAAGGERRCDEQDAEQDEERTAHRRCKGGPATRPYDLRPCRARPGPVSPGRRRRPARGRRDRPSPCGPWRCRPS